MKKTQRLEILINLADSKEKEATRSLLEVRSAIQTEEQKLKQLTEFRNQYLESAHRSEQRGMNIAQLLESRSFMEKISKAIQEQEGSIVKAENQYQEKNAEWTKIRYHKLGLKKMLDKEHRNQAKIQEKREQAAIDDRFPTQGNPVDGIENAW